MDDDELFAGADEWSDDDLFAGAEDYVPTVGKGDMAKGPVESADLSDEQLMEGRARGARRVGQRYELPEITMEGSPTGEGGRSFVSTAAPRQVNLYQSPEDAGRGRQNLGQRINDTTQAEAHDVVSGLNPMRQALGRMGAPLPPDITPVGGPAALGAGQTMGFGFMDELGGAVHALTPESMGGGTYQEGRDRVRAAETHAADTDPGAYVGGVGVGMAGLMAAPLPNLPMPAGTGALPALARTGVAALEGAGYGALGGLGASEGTTAADVGQDAAHGAATGAVTGGALRGLGETVGVLARRRAAQGDLATEANTARLRSLFEGQRPPRRQFREAMGLDDDGARLAERMATVERLGVERADDAVPALDRMGEAMGDSAAAIDEAAAAAREANVAQNAGRFGESYREGAGRLETSPVGEIGYDVADRIRARVAQMQQAQGLTDDTVAPLLREAERWERGQASGDMTFQRAWAFRRAMDDPAHWTVGPRGEMPRNKSMEREAYLIVRDEMNRAAEAAAPELAQAWREASRQYSDLAPIASAAREARMRHFQNRQVGLTDTMAAAAGGASHGPMGAIGGWLLNRTIRAREHGVVAGSYDMIRRIAERNPAQLGPFGQQLQNAAQRGPGAFAAAYFALSHQSPEFRQAVESATEEPTETEQP